MTTISANTTFKLPTDWLLSRGASFDPLTSLLDCSTNSTPDAGLAGFSDPVSATSGQLFFSSASAPVTPVLKSGESISAVTKSSDPGVAGLVSGLAWKKLNLSYSFPTAAADYGTSYGTSAGQYNDPAPFNGFAPLSAQQQADAQRALGLMSSYCKLTFTQVTDTPTSHAVIRLADSTSPSTSYAYTPNMTGTAGDIFFGTTGRNPVAGNFDSGQAVLHELGHTIGFKDGWSAKAYGAEPANVADIEYSVMNYANYIGSTAPFGTAGAGSSPQSYMMNDIATLQFLYGATYSNLGVSLTYTWSPDTGEEFINGVSQGLPYNNHIFETVWTGGATATYNLSNYNTNGVLDLRPGKQLMFSGAQLADLGYYSNIGGQTGPGPGVIFAQGNVYNALLYQNNAASEVSALLTGNGDNTIYCNDVFDTVTLGAGHDTVYAGKGGALLQGASGDTVVLSGARAQYTLSYELGQVTLTDTVAGRDGPVTTVSGNLAQFSDQTVLLTSTTPSPGGSQPPACFCTGTRILTTRGAVTVEQLRTGDRVVTHTGGVMRVRWVGRSTIDPRGADPLHVMPVRIMAGALDANVPVRDLLVSPCHAILAGGVLVQAAALVNGVTVVREQSLPGNMYWHIELDTHAVLLANGAPAESFLADANSYGFDNWDERTEPEAVEALPYPRCLAARQLPRAIRAQLAARTEMLVPMQMAA